MSIKKSPTFQCTFCHYLCSKQSEFNKHLATKKHAILSTTPKISPDHDEAIVEEETLQTFECASCDKIYRHRESLSAHKKVCKGSKPQPIMKEIIEAPSEGMVPLAMVEQMMTKQQSLFKDMVKDIICEVLKTCGPHQTTNNNTNNSHNNNKTFNLQFFLNETCKNAMNMTDFIDSIKIQLSDLIKFGEVGYVEGISNIITTNLKSLDVTERPIQCTDKKREVVYIKDDNKWEKEDDNKNKLRRLIKKVAYKNEKLLPLFKEKYPGYNNSESNHSDQYSKIVIEAFGGTGGSNPEKEDKIIRNITKATSLDKVALI
jgi:hypothetical protein